MKNNQTKKEKKKLKLEKFMVSKIRDQREINGGAHFNNEDDSSIRWPQ